MLEVKDVSYTYRSKYQTIEAVKHVTCDFCTGRLYAVMGPSGSGKSTLLSLLAGLDLPTSGEILVEGSDIASMDRDHYRRETASVVYQSFNLFPLLTALENVMYPLELQGIKKTEAVKTAKRLIMEVGLGEKTYKQFPVAMSGGEQQRIAIARALAAGGKILLADEPTGNLDSVNEANIVELLKKLAHDRGYLVIVITHNQYVGSQADVIYWMRDGQLTLDSAAGRIQV
ncbi:ATP-binding cassette domain-containing protein [Anaerocolumna sp. MB42-C2]|uniref:ATP-binding cassette domain-containing protein n=1 Tax=Anaerocolumna sp. MB42-C2 TaxID=3070997 RepID=UPI0027E0861F|nr:ATP-binding cassette domain-containing protein [Anaerocolumna sp. MB42-C2]WMJ89120.1 ATP-binding cassette domain-containing protein [Anaerocolumna sp. MB42-C2]